MVRISCVILLLSLSRTSPTFADTVPEFRNQDKKQDYQAREFAFQDQQQNIGLFFSGYMVSCR
jgi:hypothetical protein